MTLWGLLWHNRLMSNANPTHPYTLEMIPSPKGDGSFGWAIRKHGKMLERSDRAFRSEQDAMKNGQEALERAFKGAAQPSPSRFRSRSASGR
jgi:hypothetical protein